MSHHDGIQCDVCLRDTFAGGRYKCLRCHDYDLCADCFETKSSTANHVATHPMQIVFSITDMNIFFGGENYEGPELVSLTCSHCGETGFTESKLMSHLISAHTTGAEIASPVLCPLCVKRTVGNTNYVTGNLPGHLAVEHQVPCPRSLVSSLSEMAAAALRNPSGGNPTPPRRNSVSHARTHRNSMDAFFLELMSHLPDVRLSSTVRARPEGIRELQQIQSQIRQEQQAARQQLDYHRLARRAFSGEQLTPIEQAQFLDGPPPTPPPRPPTARGHFGRGNSRAATASTLEAAMFGPGGPRAGGNINLGRGNPLVRMATRMDLQTAANIGESPDSAVPVPITGGVVNTTAPGAVATGGVPKQSRSVRVQLFKPANDDLLLIKNLFKENLTADQQAIVNTKRADRSMFVQSLLFSAMCTDFNVENTEQHTTKVEVKEVKSDGEELKVKKNNKRRKRGMKKSAAQLFVAGGDDTS